jgi:T-complex protein 1 subunit eta
MDKLIHTQRDPCISNDGATVLAQLDIVHPAAKCLVEIARAQDMEVGDGTTTTTVLAGEFMREAKSLIEDGIHPQVIIQGFRLSCAKAVSVVQNLAVQFSAKSPEEQMQQLTMCASTALNSKLISGEKDYFSKMAVTAVMSLDEDKDLSYIGIKKVQGGAMRDSFLVDGVAFKKTFSYAGFEQQPKFFEKPKILLLNVELELKAEKDNAEVRMKDPSQYQSIVDAEWKIIYTKLEKCVATGAQIVLSKLPIGDLATQYFADRNIFCAGRVTADDMNRVAVATGGKVQNTTNNITVDLLGTCTTFEEKQVGNERYNLFTGCHAAKTSTIILRGGAEQFIDEAERSLHDAIMIVKRAVKNKAVVAGGGAIDMEISKALREYARSIRGKQQLVVNSFARAMEVIPRLLAENSGFDSSDILNKLRHKHHTSDEGKWFGVDVIKGDIINTFEIFVWEPQLVKINALNSATEAACVILSIDETIKNQESEAANRAAPVGGRPGGMNMSKAGMGGMARGMPGVKTLKGKGGR